MNESYKLYEHGWSPRELQAIGEFARISLSRLRRVQAVLEQQTTLAFQQQKDDALWRLQRLALIVAAAVDRK